MSHNKREDRSADQLDDRIEVVGDLDGGVAELALPFLVVVDGDVRIPYDEPCRGAGQLMIALLCLTPVPVQGNTCLHSVPKGPIWAVCPFRSRDLT